MAVVNFIDSERQWFKAAVGVPFQETERAIAFCAHAIDGSREPVVVPDATQHLTFARNPMVLGEPHIRFYACVPLVNHDGFALGTLAVLDTMPRVLAPEQIESLKILAGQAMAQLELHRQHRLLAQMVDERDQMHTEMLAQSEALRVAGQIARIGGWIVELPSLQLTLSQEIVTTYGLTCRMSGVKQILDLYLHPYRSVMQKAFEDCVRQGKSFDVEAEVVMPGDRHFWVRTAGRPCAMRRGRSSVFKALFRTYQPSAWPTRPGM